MTRQARYVNDNELRVIGMSRSGNHAIVNWLLAQMPGRTCFLNCVERKTNPFETARPMADGRRYESSDPTFNLAAERRGRWSRKDYLLYSLEDAFLGGACSRVFEQHHDAWVGASRRRFDLLILRDPFNLFASRRRSGQGGVTLGTARRIWKQHAREWLGETRWLRQERVPISYNRWFLDRAYRRSIARRLGLVFCDEGLDQVARCSGGSSFDGLSYDGRAQHMAVLERWRHYADDPEFMEIFDQEMIVLSERIFGVLPGAENLTDRGALM